MAHVESCIPPVSTVPHSGQIMYSISQQSTTWWSDHRAFPQSAEYHMVVRSCIPPVSTVPYGGQITVYSPSQHSTTWWSDHRAFHQSAQYYSTSQHCTKWWSDHRSFHQSALHKMTDLRLRAQRGILCRFLSHCGTQTAHLFINNPRNNIN